MMASSSSSTCSVGRKCSVLCVLIVLIGLVHAEGQYHKHRQHHGNEKYPRSRPRRFGRDTEAPVVQNYQSYRPDSQKLNEPYAPYSVQTTEEITPRSRHQNLRKPEFTNCDKNVNVTVPEGEPINTTVFQIEAVDRDDKNSGGTVTYTIVSGNSDNDKFVIDPTTGVIRTNKVFDRDEPEREKEEYVTIRASDNGRPQLDSVCTLKITITDINDGVPLFEKFEYKESVPRDLPSNQVVMRISATDIDAGENGTVWYKLESHPDSPGDVDYFQISENTGEVQLKKPIDANAHTFRLRAVATDRGHPPKSIGTNLTISVRDPRTRPPVFLPHKDVIHLRERGVDKTIPIVSIIADSKAESSLVFFELVNGQTEATNKAAMFTLESEGNTAQLKLDKDLDYETVSKYTLTIRAFNKDNLANETTITVFVEDDNDEKPDFTEVTSGAVLENEPKGTSVMRVRAIDRDGTSPNNLVKYSLKEEDKENFDVDEDTGEITTKKEFDREAKDVYQVTVIARDGSPSALRRDGKPNERPVTLKIEIADKNDNEPHFVQSNYEAEISENADLNNKVIEVKAIDNDTASEITYSITHGNIGDAFKIESTKSGGVVKVNQLLDYEQHREYSLTVTASDSLHDAYANIQIKVLNINDEIPKFEKMDVNTTIMEETVPVDCIFNLKAYDPDIGNRHEPQNISFFINKGQDYFAVDNKGCVKVTKPLDRDPPHGQPFWQMTVGAYDEWGLTTTKKAAYQILLVNLQDKNDNAPYLSSPNPVIWNENQPKGPIGKLAASDNDTPENGAPFHFAIDRAASSEIRTLFKIEGSTIYADKDNFDREHKKEYLVPIEISDSGKDVQTGTSTLTVVIGDINDNRMFPGESKIFVYKYKDTSTVPIGQVFVEDADDWDLDDKTFDWVGGRPHTYFTLDNELGMISMKPNTPANVYQLLFKVTDSKFNDEVAANVTVTVKEITDEAVDNSGSIRFMGITPARFVEPGSPDGRGPSKKDILQAELANIFNVPLENVDVFTVLSPKQYNDPNLVDVRYSVHNSPYWKAEKLDGILAANKEVLQRALQLNILMIRIDECINEKVHCESSCINHLNKEKTAYKIYTNRTSFVGVDADVVHQCTCELAEQQNSCFPNNPCLHQGVCKSGEGLDVVCECRPGFDGPRCETTSASFPGGNAYAWYPPVTVCNNSLLEVQFTTLSKNGLILYNGPIFRSPMNVTDFISLELVEGRPLLLMDYGSGVTRIELKNSPNLANSVQHKISIKWSPTGISLIVDECPRPGDPSCNSGSVRPTGDHTQLNVNGPLQLGGLSFKPSALQTDMNWSSVPSTHGFAGCIANLTFNGKYYNLGFPSYAKNMNVTDCANLLMTGTWQNTLGVDWNFIIVIIVSTLVLLLLIIAFLVYRKRRSYEEVKGEFNDDVRDNILHYSDEGGGEGDQTGYDLSVLMKPSNGPPYINPHIDKIAMDDLSRQGRAPDTGEGPDIQSFLNGNKNKVDNDPDGLPYDDVRNYAYEGDNNSMGSLSSLASGTDDEDLNFDFLPAFGPRFKKLADMYGGQSSDDESYTPPPEAWC